MLKWLIEQDKKMKENGREGRLLNLTFCCSLCEISVILGVPEFDVSHTSSREFVECSEIMSVTKK